MFSGSILLGVPSVLHRRFGLLQGILVLQRILGLLSCLSGACVT